MTRMKPTPSSQTSSSASMTGGTVADHREGKTHVVPGGHGHAFEVKKGSSFRIIDLHGRQIVDMMAWVLPYPDSLEHLSMSYTRYVLNGEAPPAVGDCLVTNKVCFSPYFYFFHPRYVVPKAVCPRGMSCN